MPPNEPSRYGAVSQWLHWTTVALVIVLIVMGKAGDIEADEPDNLMFFWHSSLGVLVFVLALARIVWYFAGPHPPFPESMSRSARGLARAVHVSLYALLLALPLSGWLVTSTEGVAAPVFGVGSLPSLNVHRLSGVPVTSVTEGSSVRAQENEGREDAFKEIHEVLGNILLVLASLHVLAALKHQFIDRDDVLARMLPARFKRGHSGD
jgi:cytochrome b561